MSPRNERAKHSAKKPVRESGAIDQILIIRLVVAAVILAVALIVKMPTIVRVILYILSIAISAYDLVLRAMDEILEGRYISDPLLIVVTAILAVLIGFGAEGAALVLVYQFSLLLFRLAEKLTRKSAFELLGDMDEESKQRMKDTLADRSSLKLNLAGEMQKASVMLLRAVMVFALLYAILLPLLSGFTYRVSIHRGLMILMACLPGSVVAAMPLTALVSLCHSARNGVLFNNAAGMEKAASVNLAVCDKAGVFSAGEPEVLAVQSGIESLEDDAFLNMAAHAVYYSEQPFAKAITAKANVDYRLDVISDFEDLPGGVKLNIGPSPIVLAKAETFERLGIVIPTDPDDRGQIYYMTLAGRYIGKIMLSEEIASGAGNLVEDLKESGVNRIVLVTEDGPTDSRRIAEELGVDDVYGECDTERKLKLLDDLSQGPRNRIMYVYANGIETHSQADLDVRVSRKSKYADVLVLPEKKNALPAAISICKRMLDVASKNGLFVVIVKALLIFLSILGYSKIWFVLFIDAAAQLATMLNAIRVTKESTLDKILRKS